MIRTLAATSFALLVIDTASAHAEAPLIVIDRW
jgi:hypothetical protein